jgi:hypothetical protein
MNHHGEDRFPPKTSNFLTQVVGGFKPKDVSNNSGSPIFLETEPAMAEKGIKELICVKSVS